MNKGTPYILMVLVFLFLTPIVESAENIEMIWRLKDRVSSSPVEGVGVVCEIGGPRQLIRTERIYTDAEGQFSLEFDSQYDNKPLNLLVYKSGYKETTFVDNVQRGRFLPRYLYLSASPEGKEPVREKRNLVILGTVKDSGNEKLLPGVLLDYNLRMHGSTVVSKQDITDSSGGFTWQFDGKLSQGLLTFKANKSNYVSYRQTRTLGEGGKLDIDLVPMGENKGFSQLQPWQTALLVAGAGCSMFTVYYDHVHPSKSDAKVVLVTVSSASLIALGASFFLK